MNKETNLTKRVYKELLDDLNNTPIWGEKEWKLANELNKINYFKLKD
jgi:hypothetical protein